MPKYYTVDEVAKILKVGYRKVLSEINAGNLKAFNLGNTYRVSQEQIDDWLERNINE